jgi:N-succinyldiaminopimelate aminotransferase
MPIANRVAAFGTTIFTEMTQLALKHNAINLSQGFPDFDGPEEVKEAAIAAIRSGQNQYSQSAGQPELRRAIAAHAKRFYGQTVDPDTEVTVCTGASETLFSTILGLINSGDEVILFEPYFDIYVPDITIAGGVPNFVPLRTRTYAGGGLEWYFDNSELAAAFNERTRAIIVNTPHNPTGKVFTRDELQFIANLCQQWDVLAITDEVYEHIIFDGVQHLRMAQLPGMADRTITISSQGKSFSFTGWKIGWAIAPADLTVGIRRMHQTIPFASSTPFQLAAAFALGLDDEYFHALAADYQHKRDFLAKVLLDTGLTLSIPSGTYFIMANFASLGRAFENDMDFCRYLISDIGIAAIPPTAFYSEEHRHLGQQWTRFAFCKRMETLERAAERLVKLKG